MIIGMFYIVIVSHVHSLFSWLDGVSCTCCTDYCRHESVKV